MYADRLIDRCRLEQITYTDDLGGGATSTFPFVLAMQCMAVQLNSEDMISYGRDSTRNGTRFYLDGVMATTSGKTNPFDLIERQANTYRIAYRGRSFEILGCVRPSYGQTPTQQNVCWLDCAEFQLPTNYTDQT